MPDYIPPSLRTRYFRRFAMWLGVMWLGLGLSVVFNAELARDIWQIARYAAGALGIAVLFAFVHFGPNDT